MKTIYHAKGPQKKAGVEILISDNLDFKTETVVRDVEGHNIIFKGSIQEENLTIVNIYASNMGATNYINQQITKIKKHTDNNTLIVGDFNTSFTAIERSSMQKISKEIRVLNDTLNEMDFVDIYRTFHSKTTEYSFFSSVHGTFSKIDHILGHKSGLNQYQEIGIIPAHFWTMML